jgi:hypothetical protein
MHRYLLSVVLSLSVLPLKTKYWSCAFVVLLLWFLSAQSVYAQKQVFKGYTSYHSVVQTHRLNKSPTVQVQRYEIVPPFTSDCQTIIIDPGNGCRVEISSLINPGVPQISEIASPRNLESTVLEIQILTILIKVKV